MAKTGSRSLASRAGSVARRVAGRSSTTSAAKAAEQTAKKSAAQKAAATTPAKRPAARKSVAKAPAKKAAAKQAPAKKVVAKAPAKKAPAKKAPGKKAPAKKAPGKQAAAKQAPAKQAPVTKVAAKKAPATKTAATKTAAKKTAATKAPPEQAPATKAPAGPKARKGSPGALVVLAGERPWTKDELAEVRAHLRADVKRLAAELEVAEEELHDLMRDAGDGAGHDQADVGSTTFERDQEMVITNNAREMLIQSQHALDRISDGTFGVCESCGEPIGKMRLMAFPRATLCMTCKQREERR